LAAVQGRDLWGRFAFSQGKVLNEEMRCGMHLLRVMAWAVVFAMCGVPAAYGLRETTQLTPKSIGVDSALAGQVFAVKVEKIDGGRLRFTFSAEGKEVALSPYMAGELTVMDGDKQVVVCALEQQGKKGAAKYSFEVAAKYLANSKFTFRNSAMTPEGEIAPLYYEYWINLSDFTPEK